MPTKTQDTRYTMSDQHKASLAEGRRESRIVKEYLTALEENKPKRGRRRTPDTITARLHDIAEALASNPGPYTRLSLITERTALTEELEQMEARNTTVYMADLEKQFIAVAAPYGQKRGIPYSAWRELGVPASVLRQAGVARSA